MPDKKLTCRDCSQEFTFTEGEQEFYKEKGFENDPQRCPDCRRAKKQQHRDSGGGGARKPYGGGGGSSSRW